MFKVLVLQTLYTLSDEQTEYQLRDRWSFMRFVGLASHDPVPDAKTIWLYREQLARAGATEKLFARFDALLREKVWLVPKSIGGGQIIDATVIEARRPRLSQAEKDTVKGGGVPAQWTSARRARSTATGAGRSSANAMPGRAATSGRSILPCRCLATISSIGCTSTLRSTPLKKTQKE